MHQRNLVVLTGSSGVGKSTSARALQEVMLPEIWLHFSADTVLYCWPRSLVARVDELNDHSAVDSNAVIAGAYACAKTLLGLGHKVVFDVVVLSEKGARGVMEAFREFDPLIVELTCAWPEIERRTLARGDRTLAEAEHGFKNAGGHLTPDLTFDTTASSAEEVAARIAVELASAM